MISREAANEIIKHYNLSSKDDIRKITKDSDTILLPRINGISVMLVNGKYFIYGSFDKGLHCGVNLCLDLKNDSVLKLIYESRNPLYMFEVQLKIISGSWKTIDNLPKRLIGDFYVDIYANTMNIQDIKLNPGIYKVDSEYSIRIISHPYTIILHNNLDDKSSLTALNLTDIYESIPKGHLEKYKDIVIGMIRVYFGLDKDNNVPESVVLLLDNIFYHTMLKIK